MTIAVKMRGIDFASMPDSDGYAGIARKGAGFVSRYSAGVGGALNSKCTQPGEIADAVRHGVDFLANFELAENTREGGARPGKEHGAADRDFWASRGLADGAGVTLSWEPGDDPSKFGAVADFLTSYKEAIGRPVGLYAGLKALLEMRHRDLIDFTWLPMSSAASGLNFGDISQTEYAARMLKVAQDNGLNVVQNRNRWYKHTDGQGNVVFGADENIVVKLPGIPWSQMQASGHFHHPAPMPPHHPPHTQHAPKMWQGERWPGPKLRFGPGDHFGNINGPAQSHGGATADERTYVKMIQQRLIACGFVPGHSGPSDRWADGVFDTAGNGQLGGPTTEAVKRFQAACRPGHLTTEPGQVWPDDWATLFNLS
jgi:hypothetical protein